MKPNPDNTQPDNYQCTLSTTDRLVVPSNFSAISSAKKDETLVNFIKTKHPAKGEREDKERGPKSEPKTQKPKGGAQKEAKDQIMFQYPGHQSQESISYKERGRNLKA